MVWNGNGGSLLDGNGNWKSPGTARLRSRWFTRAVREARPVILL
jgi:hypothetical protein